MNHFITVSFEDITADVVQMVVLWVHTPCSIMCSDVLKKRPTSILRVINLVVVNI
jgi:hypothetical protein